ncbi:DUF6454 family protein [Paenibacillus allorhizosphaerae]|uniref:Uncharacterized protein n=1 Tax=Paenibacillus allorhizosphaerae TaxID=2849866 RepID=A0ABM8VA89_9BACL|nr:DUF6454 family protein [Paenibacillus allorhizosphaerae]CAG7615775.1 hypothetical protein PAECIP111802_00210 [Paenibacillus allorhizosphaerae]
MNNAKLIAQFRYLTRNTKWEQKERIDLQFNNHHPQGMIRIGDLFYLSSVELIERPVRFNRSEDRYDRTPGRGIGHLFIFDKHGQLAGDMVLGEGDMYHPGGIDFDGRHLWVSVAEYRPHSQSIVYKVDPATRKAEPSFRVADHIGGVVRNGQEGELIGYSWGSRKFYKWSPDGQLLQEKENPSHFIDYQDGRYVGEGKMIVSGISELPEFGGRGSKRFELGGLALIDINTLETVHEVPVLAQSPQGHVITRNPVFLESAGQGIRLYAVPDDDHGSLLVYETSL